jgi:hypothetical protein
VGEKKKNPAILTLTARKSVRAECLLNNRIRSRPVINLSTLDLCIIHHLRSSNLVVTSGAIGPIVKILSKRSADIASTDWILMLRLALTSSLQADSSLSLFGIITGKR